MLALKTDASWSYHRETNCVVVEVSQLREQLAGRYLHTVLTITSHRSGAVREFVRTSTDKDLEGEVQGWRYRTEGGLELLIIND